MPRIMEFVLWCGLLLSQRMLAEPAQGTPLVDVLSKAHLDSEDTDPLFLRSSDDPDSFTKELLALWGQVSSQKDPLLKARIGWWIGRVTSSYPEGARDADLEGIFAESVKLVEDTRVQVSVEDLRIFLFNIRIDKNAELTTEIKAKMLEMARKLPDVHTRAFVLAAFAGALSERDLSFTSLASIMNEIREIIVFPPEGVFPADIETMSNLRVNLSLIGQEAEAEEIGRKLDQLCAAKELRKICAIRAYVVGIDLADDASEDKRAEAIKQFERALDLAGKIQDQSLVAYSYYGLGNAYQKNKNFQKAIENSLKSSSFFEKNGPKDWAAAAYKELSISYLGNKNLKESLKAAQKALTLCPPEFKRDLSGIYGQLADINAALENFGEAYRYLKLHTEVEKLTRTEDSNKKYMELRNVSLTRQNELQGEQIQLLSKFRLVSIVALTLSLLVCGALLMVRRQAGIIQRSRQKMQEVLDHIDEGIVTIDERLQIEKGYSPHLGKILGHAAEALNHAYLLELLFPSDSSVVEAGILAKEALRACIGGESLSWELNRAHLPAEVVLGQSILALHWQPLFNAKGLISRFLVSIRDITELRAIEKKAQVESERVQGLQLKLKEILGGQISQIRNLFAELKQEWEYLGERILVDADKVSSLRRLHTWKGAARTLGLKHLAGRIHEMESCLIPSVEFSPQKTRGKWNDLSLVVEDYEHLLNTLLVRKESGEFKATDLYAYANLYAAEMKERLEGVGCPIKGVMVLDQVLRWKPEVLPLIHEILIHAISNATDHGFIRAIQMNKRAAPALIQIQAVPVGDEIELKIIDNGAGINWSGLKKKAESVGFVSVPGQSLSQILFEDGVSTAETTSETSGRGVGLGVIRSLCLKLGGTMFLEDADGGGAVLRLGFPSPRLMEESMAG